MLKSILQAASLAAAVLAGTPAPAQDKLPDIHVHYGDLDLSQPAGVQALDRRLARAVKASCPSDDGLRELARLRPILRCRADKRAALAPLREAALASAAQDQKSFAAR